MKVGFFGLLVLMGLGFATGYATHDGVQSSYNRAQSALSSRK